MILSSRSDASLKVTCDVTCYTDRSYAQILASVAGDSYGYLKAGSRVSNASSGKKESTAVEEEQEEEEEEAEDEQVSKSLRCTLCLGACYVWPSEARTS